MDRISMPEHEAEKYFSALRSLDPDPAAPEVINSKAKRIPVHTCGNLLMTGFMCQTLRLY